MALNPKPGTLQTFPDFCLGDDRLLRKLPDAKAACVLNHAGTPKKDVDLHRV